MTLPPGYEINGSLSFGHVHQYFSYGGISGDGLLALGSGREFDQKGRQRVGGSANGLSQGWNASPQKQQLFTTISFFWLPCWVNGIDNQKKQVPSGARGPEGGAAHEKRN